MLQHGSYTLLIDACYDREKFPTLEEAIEWTWASSTAEIEAVEFVLRKFFTKEGEVYVQKRIQEEIEQYQNKSATNKRIAIERETIRKEKHTNRERLVNESPPNHKPLTNNHKPLVVQKHCAPKSALDDGFIEFWNIYPKKSNKLDAERAWKKQKPRIDDVLKTLQWQIESNQWTKQKGSFIPNPATYINKGGWLSEPEAEITF